MAGDRVFQLELQARAQDGSRSWSIERVLARHASESDPFFAARLVALGLLGEEPLVVREGVCRGDEPAFWRGHPSLPYPLEAQPGRDLLALWVEIGRNLPQRPAGAARRADRVVQLTWGRQGAQVDVGLDANAVQRWWLNERELLRWLDYPRRKLERELVFELEHGQPVRVHSPEGRELGYWMRPEPVAEA
jgi:uncharacterized protein YaeQ